jgi:hypothetical protein
MKCKYVMCCKQCNWKALFHAEVGEVCKKCGAVLVEESEGVKFELALLDLLLKTWWGVGEIREMIENKIGIEEK